MEMFTQTMAAVLSVYLTVVVGWFISRRRLFDEGFPAMGTRVVVNILYPALMLRFVMNNEALRIPENLILPPLLGFGLMALGLVIARAVARVCKLGDDAAQRTFAFVTAINNYGYIPIPLCIALFDASTVGVLMVFNMGMEAAVWIFGPLTLSGKQFSIKNLKALVNPVLIALFLGLTLNLCHAQEHMPAFASKTLTEFLTLLGNAAIPLALLLIGATLHNILRQFGFKADWPVIGWGVFLRQLAIPAVMIALVAFLPMSIELRKVLVVQAAMPCGIFPILMSAHYGGKPMAALQVALSTSVCALALTPLWLIFGMKLVG